MQNIFKLTTPVDKNTAMQLRAGDMVEICGVLFTARDAAHARMMQALNEGKNCPFNIMDQVLYYVGPTPTRPGHIIGSAGPTTAGRMDSFAPKLLELGLRGMIGKGEMGAEVAKALMKYKGIYFAAIGGAGAQIAQKIIKNKIIAYEDLGPEAIRELTVMDFPVIVAQDTFGGNIFKSGREKYKTINSALV